MQATYSGLTATQPFTASHTKVLWHLNEAAGTTVTDTSGHGFNGTISGSVNYQVNGPNFTGPGGGNAPGHYGMQLTGAQYVQVDSEAFASYPTTGAAPTPNYNHSVQVWFRAAQAGMIFGQANPSRGATVPAIYLGSDNKVHASMFWHGAATTTTSTTATYNDNNWHQVVVTFFNGAEALYVDGALEGTRSALTERPYATAYVYRLGEGIWQGWPNAGAGNANSLTGELAEFAFYSYALDAAEVTADFTAKGIAVP